MYCNVTYKSVSNGIVFRYNNDNLPIFIMYSISNKSNNKINTYKFIRKLNNHTIHKYININVALILLIVNLSILKLT